MKIVLGYDARLFVAQRLAELERENLHVTCASESDSATFLAELADAEVLWHVLQPVTAEQIAAAPRLRLIQKIGVGVNTIDLETAKARGIAVCNMPGTNTRAVAEMTLLLMLGALRRIAFLDSNLRAGGAWLLDREVQAGFGEIGGRVVGLVGYGAIPAMLTPVLQALGAQVVYWTRQPKPEAVAEWRSLEDLLGESDIVSLHLPLVPDTERLLDARRLAQMKPGAILINTARGALVDEAALVQALKNGPLSAAGLDVFAREPMPAGHPLFALPNVVLAPHVAWLTPETWRRSVDIGAENCRRLGAGRELLHRVI
jgi:phosphoglycerate dehydrogenase-like enzyme